MVRKYCSKIRELALFLWWKLKFSVFKTFLATGIFLKIFFEFFCSWALSGHFYLKNFFKKSCLRARRAKFAQTFYFKVFRNILFQIHVSQSQIGDSAIYGPELSFTCRTKATLEVISEKTRNTKNGENGAIGNWSADGSFSGTYFFAQLKTKKKWFFGVKIVNF